MDEKRDAPREGNVYASRKQFEDAVFAFVRGDPFTYMKKGCTETEHRITCHRASSAVRCEAIFRIRKRDTKTDGPGWVCVEAEPLHSEQCLARRRAELAKEAESRGDNESQVPAAGPRSQGAEASAAYVYPTPQPSTDSRYSSLHAPPANAELAATNPSSASPPLRGLKLSQTSDEVALAAMSQSLPSSHELQPDAHVWAEISAELAKAGVSAVDAGAEEQIAMAETSGMENAARSPRAKPVDRHHRKPALSTAVQDMANGLDTAIVDMKPPKPPALPVKRRKPTDRWVPEHRFPPRAASVSPSAADQSSQVSKAPTKPPSSSTNRSSRPLAGYNARKSAGVPVKQARALSQSSSEGVQSKASTQSTGATPEDLDDRAYCPTKPVDQTVWSAPKNRSPKKPRLSESDVDDHRKLRSRGNDRSRRTRPNPRYAESERSRDSVRVRHRTEETLPSSRGSGTADLQRRLVRRSRGASTADDRDIPLAAHHYPSRDERGVSPELHVVCSKPPGSDDSRHAQYVRHYDGEERLNLPQEKATKPVGYVQDWSQNVAESVREDISPYQSPAGMVDRTLASIEFFPQRVLATFHRLGYERVGDLTARGVRKSDYAALIRHIGNLPPEDADVSDVKSFDEIEAWVAERRLLEL